MVVYAVRMVGFYHTYSELLKLVDAVTPLWTCLCKWLHLRLGPGQHTQSDGCVVGLMGCLLLGLGPAAAVSAGDAEYLKQEACCMENMLDDLRFWSREREYQLHKLRNALDGRCVVRCAPMHRRVWDPTSSPVCVVCVPFSPRGPPPFRAREDVQYAEGCARVPLVPVRVYGPPIQGSCAAFDGSEAWQVFPASAGTGRTEGVHPPPPTYPGPDNRFTWNRMAERYYGLTGASEGLLSTEIRGVCPRAVQTDRHTGYKHAPVRHTHTHGVVQENTLTKCCFYANCVTAWVAGRRSEWCGGRG